MILYIYEKCTIVISAIRNFRGLRRHIRCVFPEEVAFRIRYEGYVPVGYVKKEEKTVLDGQNGTWEGCMWGKSLNWHLGGTVKISEQWELDKRRAT